MPASGLLWPFATVFLLVWTLPLISRAESLRETYAPRREVIVRRHGVVATDDGRCSRIGMEVLKAKGNAIDAAVASAFCLGVVSPGSSGIGGGAFMLVRLAHGKAKAFDMRETAPLKATENMYNGNLTLKARGGLAVAVPGAVAGLFEAWKQHGKLQWKRLISPAEELARKGFKVSSYLNMQINSSASEILADKGLREIFASKGKLLQTGDICKNNKLAETLRKIAKYGPKAFYNGSVGYNLVKDIQSAGGIITMKDLQSYVLRIKEPLVADVLGYKILGMPPPSSGGPSMILILNMLAQYGIPSGVMGSLGVHRQIEALKHAFAVRMNLGDPDFADTNRVVSDMLSVKFAKKLKESIDDSKTFDPSHYGGRWNQIIDHGTSHMAIADEERNAVSMTATINYFFGAKVLSPSTGVVLNNEMDDFSIPMKDFRDDVPPPAPANFIRPGKRPLSSMTPTIVLKDGKLKAVVGASGGANIIAGTTEVLMNHAFRGMDPFASVMAPRIYHQLIPNIVQFENWTVVTGDHFEVPLSVRTELQKKGHSLEPLAGGTVCQFVVQNLEEYSDGNGGSGELVAVSDPRKGGFPAGY